MKRKITLLLLAAGSMFKMNSQVVLSENFTSPFNASAAGWVVINNSVPQGSVSWAQGNSTGGNGTLTAYNGSTDDFYMADFLSIPINQSGGISAFLITPTLTIYNGAVLQFATSTFSNPNIFPDRLQVLMSQTGNTTIATNTTAVGSFTDILLDINPNLTTNTSSVVSNGTVNGYPQAWTVYSVPVTGVTGTVTGRFAFRYFVSNGGSAGANSRLVALDAVGYGLPCGPTVQSFTTCAGASTTLTAIGGLPTTNYLWNTASTSSSIVVSPASTTVYTLTPSAGSTPCGVDITATVTVGSQLSINVSASNQTICSGNSVLLTAVSPAASYAWTSGSAVLGTASTLVVTPSVTTTYSVGGLNGVCQGSGSITINVNASPSLSVALSPACLGGSITINASGAATYTYLASSTNPQSIASPTAVGGYNFTLGGTAANGCTSFGLVTFTVNANPTVTAVASKTFVCINNNVNISATGADTYSWSAAATSTAAAFSYSSATVGLKTFSVVGTSTTGCSDNAVVTVSVSLCTGIENVDGSDAGSSVFPNPFVNQLSVSGLEGSIEVYNALGQVVIKSSVANTETFNTTELPKGAYILKAYNKEGETVKTIKLLKN